MKVFISSVISGMEEFREAVARAARALGHEVIQAEDFGARPDSPQTACLAGVRDAEAMVLLIGARYGAPQSSGLSATHEEYHEARERCPVLVMVQEGAEHETEQAAFLREVQDWAQGHYTKNFADAAQLQDAVTRALHELELAHATGPVDPAEMLERCLALLPDDERGHSGAPRLALGLTGGPLHTVLRPAQLEAPALAERIQQIALFGEASVFSTRQGTEIGIEDDALVLEQPDRSVAITETGAIRFITAIPEPDGGMYAIIEEEVQDLIARFLRFANAALAHIDPVNRLTHVALAARVLDAGHHAWRTRAEHARSPNSMTVNIFGDSASEPAHLSPPHRTRPALRLNIDELAQDLTVKLRRLLQNPRRNPW